MAGTPTRYYGFPTYADSDAVDLTAQYNTAVTNIDSELHQLNVKMGDRNITMVVLGDSWAGSSAYNSWVDIVAEDLGVTTLSNRAVPGARSDSFASQLQAAITDIKASYIDYLVVLGGVNDFTAAITFSTVYNNVNGVLSELSSIGVGRAVFIPNCGYVTNIPNTPEWRSRYISAFSVIDVYPRRMPISYNILDSFYAYDLIDSSNGYAHPNARGIADLPYLIEQAILGNDVNIATSNISCRGGHGLFTTTLTNNSGVYMITDMDLYNFAVTHCKLGAETGCRCLLRDETGVDIGYINANYNGSVNVGRLTGDTINMTVLF